MKKIMPQEIEVWYLIPALRKEFAKIFINDYGLSQKKAAEILGITNSAISQYLSLKRGNEMNFNKKERELVKKAAKEVIEKNSEFIKKLYELCILLRESKTICEIHKSRDKSVAKNCDVCFS